MEKKHYTKEHVTVVWQPKKCIHSAVCVRGLPTVFQPASKPWIKMEGASVDAIAAQVRKCPSGALSLLEDQEATSKEDVAIECATNGPYLVKGSVTIVHADGTSETKENAALCRCGGSMNKPFCDGSHRKIGFAG